ncbi:MAG: cell division protein FtsA [Mangrovibacterium sp.]
MGKSNKLIAAIDVGTTKVIALAGRLNQVGRMEIMGFGKSRSMGVKRGVVLNIREAFQSVHEAVSQAEKTAGEVIEEVYVNVGGQQLKTFTLNAELDFGETRMVTEEDLRSLLLQAEQAKLPEGYKVYHLAPQRYTVDEEAGIPEPVGITGEKLAVSFKLLAGPEQYEQNLRMCMDRAGILIRKTLVDSMGPAEVLLSEDEKEAGVVLLDIGGGTTKMTVYCDGLLCYSSLVPFGGNVITRDIKEGCSILARQAEALKVQFGQAMGDFAPSDKVVTIPGISGWEPKEISFKNLAYIIQARMEEIIDACYFQLEKSACLDRIGAGIVITGGGAQLHNLGQLIKYRTGLDVRQGVPRIRLEPEWKELKNPGLATAVGLLHLALQEPLSAGKKRTERKRKQKNTQPGFFSQVKQQVARQVTLFFEEEQDMEMH